VRNKRRFQNEAIRGGEAARLAPAFQMADLQAELQTSEVREPASAFRPVQPTADETPAQASLSWNAAEAV
jgi:hypothetical protein